MWMTHWASGSFHGACQWCSYNKCIFQWVHQGSCITSNWQVVPLISVRPNVLQQIVTGLCFGMFFCSFCFWCFLLAKQLHTNKTTFRPKTSRRHALLGHQQRQLSSQRQKTCRVGSQLKINIPGKMHKNAMLDWGGSGRTKKHTTTMMNHL